MIDTPQALSELCLKMEASPCIALDTEFISGKYPKPVLSIVQIALSSEETYLIDARAFEDLSALKPFLEHDNIVKLLHDAVQDLILLSPATHAIPKNVFDVKLAARLLGIGTNYSLSEIAVNLLDIHLSKSQQRSNWLRRPLSDAQIRYAIQDVKYLHEMRKILLIEAKRKGRTAWLDEEMQLFNDPANYLPPSPTERLLSFPEVQRFIPGQCAAVEAVVKWRTKQSHSSGVSEKDIMRNSEILRLIKRKCKKPGAVRNTCSSLPRRHVNTVANLISSALKTPASACPSPLGLRKLTNAEAAVLQLLQAIVLSRATEYGIEAALLGKSAILTEFILKPEDPSNLLRKGWRWTVVGQDLSDVLRGDAWIGLSGGLLKVQPHSQ